MQSLVSQAIESMLDTSFDKAERRRFRRQMVIEFPRAVWQEAVQGPASLERGTPYFAACDQLAVSVVVFSVW